MIPKRSFYIIKISNFRGDLSDIPPPKKNQKKKKTTLEEISAQKRLFEERNSWVDRLNRGTQEIARVNTQITYAQSKLSDLTASIEEERKVCTRITQLEKVGRDRFGPFALSTSLMPDLGTLRIDIEPIHELNSETRKYVPTSNQPCFCFENHFFLGGIL